MPLDKKAPLHVLWQAGLTRDHLIGIDHGIRHILWLAGLAKDVKVHYLEQRREPDWLIQLGPFKAWYYKKYSSLDWHIHWAGLYSKMPGYLNSTMLLSTLNNDPTHGTEPHYELVAMNQPLYWNAVSMRKVVGIGQAYRGAIVDIGRYLYLLSPPPDVEKESLLSRNTRALEFILYTKMLTIHELGHVLGLWPGTGNPNPTDAELQASHCPNKCVMWWQENLELYKEIAGKPLCDQCIAKLKQLYKTP